MIERYDRVGGRRVYQEELSQALGVSRNQKYQEMGGGVSLRRVAEMLTRHAPEQDLAGLARVVILAVGIGNLDLHTKNIGLLHPTDGPVRLAPAYDVVPQAHMRNDGKLALAVNGKYRHADVTGDDLLAEFTSWGLRRAAATIVDTLDELEEAVKEEVPLDGALPAVQEQILVFIHNLRDDAVQAAAVCEGAAATG